MSLTSIPAPLEQPKAPQLSRMTKEGKKVHSHPGPPQTKLNGSPPTYPRIDTKACSTPTKPLQTTPQQLQTQLLPLHHPPLSIPKPSTSKSLALLPLHASYKTAPLPSNSKSHQPYQKNTPMQKPPHWNKRQRNKSYT
ncbi:hypothetical protein C0989_002419, partial [Termitomyces sp. Mn162]